MKQLIIIVISIVVLVGGGVVLFNTFSPGGASLTVQEGFFNQLSSLSFADYEGNTVSLKEFEGKPLVLNSWAVWCPFCRDELPDFAELQKEFGEQVTVIAIDRQEPLKKAKEYTDELGISNDMLFLLDSSDSFYKTIGGFSMPETIFLNGAGDIVVHKRGPMDLAEMREHTNKIISTGQTSP